MINHLVSQRYEVLEKVGESALFAVYKARDKTANRIVAVKVLQPAFAADTEFVEALQTALNATSRLNHPLITQFYDFGFDDNGPYFVTEFVRGINLKERIRRIAPFTLSVAIDFACSIAEALHYAHCVGMVHGDLRPQNIIISPEGALRVTDFGVQTAIARSPHAQEAKLAAAAPYHAPELSVKLPGSVAGDIYALGAILYEMLTGTTVYAGDTPEAMAEQHALLAIPSPRATNPGIPRSVEGIILKCLQKRPEYRYRTMADLLNDLKSVRDALRFGKPLSWTPVEVEPPPIVAPVARPVESVIPVAPPPAPEPVVEVAASSIPAMPANRLRAADERVSIYLKIAIGMVMAIILACAIGFVSLYMSYWVLPKPVNVPKMVGKPIEEVRLMAQHLNVHLIEHGDYSDRPRDVVYKTDYETQKKIHPGQTINVWYSKGAAYVNVPNVVNLDKESAERKLKEAGLSVGRVSPEYNDIVSPGIVIRQNVSYKKRVFHDTAVDLVVSDGPKPDYGANTENTPPSDTNATQGNDDNATANQNAADDNNDADNSDESRYGPAKTFHRVIRIPTDDHLGLRQVRIEFKDARGWQPPVIDEMHNEGDAIPVTFDYYGKGVTLRVYYDNKAQRDFKFSGNEAGGNQ